MLKVNQMKQVLLKLSDTKCDAGMNNTAVITGSACFHRQHKLNQSFSNTKKKMLNGAAYAQRFKSGVH